MKNILLFYLYLNTMHLLKSMLQEFKLYFSISTFM